MAAPALSFIAAAAAALAARRGRADDPFDSGMWESHRRELLGDPADIVFDPALRVLTPAFAEDPMHVPALVDARALGPVRRIVVTADYSPIPRVLDLEPGAAAPVLGFGFKVEQGTPLRAAVELADGRWRWNGAQVPALGGGCTAPAAAHGRPDWQEGLGEIRARLWPDGRLRLRLRHPMDTGLADGIPAFFLTEIVVAEAAGRALTTVRPHEPVEEDPSLTLFLPAKVGRAGLRISARDNMGGVFSARLTAEDHG